MFQITLHARNDGLLSGSEFLARDLLIHLNVAPRELENKLGRCFWKYFVFVRVGVFFEPQAEELFVEIFRLFPLRDALFVTRELPIA